MENTGNTKRNRIMIVGAGSTGLMALKMAEEKIKSGEIILVDSIEEISRLTGVNVDEVELIVEGGKSNPFENPIPYVNPYIREELTDIKFFNESFNNPWPSPKGRNGKRRY